MSQLWPFHNAASGITRYLVRAFGVGSAAQGASLFRYLKNSGDIRRPSRTLTNDRRECAVGAVGGPQTIRRFPADRPSRAALRHQPREWAGTPIGLTLIEFKIIALLALRVGEDVSYWEIYDLVHGKDFSVGYVDEGYRPTFALKRIRKKLRAVDPEFEHIQNYAGFGYRYHRSAG